MKIVGLITIIMFVFAMYYHSKEDSQQNSVVLTHQAELASSISSYQNNALVKNHLLESVQTASTENRLPSTSEILELYVNKKSKIEKLENGSTKVDISTPNMDRKLEIISTSEIYYPSETDLNYGVRGCSLGGYYVELNANITMIEIAGNQKREFHFKCIFSELNNSYTLMQIVN